LSMISRGGQCWEKLDSPGPWGSYCLSPEVLSFSFCLATVSPWLCLRATCDGCN
jgi:hypothetical protein